MLLVIPIWFKLTHFYGRRALTIGSFDRSFCLCYLAKQLVQAQVYFLVSIDQTKVKITDDCHRDSLRREGGGWRWIGNTLLSVFRRHNC